MLTIFVGCTKRGLEAGKHVSAFLFLMSESVGPAICAEPLWFHRAVGVAVFSVLLGVGTDLLLVGVPIRLL